MEIMCLDEQYRPLGMLDDFSSLQWKRAYYGLPTVELHLTDDWFELLRDTRYLYRSDLNETMLLHTMEIKDGESIVVKGCGLKGLLDRLVIYEQTSFSGTAAEVVGDFIAKFAINPKFAGNKIPGLRLGIPEVRGSQISVQATGDNLMAKIDEILMPEEISWDVVLDYLQSELVVRIWQGNDRTEGQTENSWATFSKDYENLDQLDYIRSDEAYRNFAYVAGAGEGKDRVFVEVDQTNGEPRRELFVDARDLQPKDDDGNAIADGSYREMLRQRGLESLSEYPRQQEISGIADVGSNLIYRVDFDLGDRVTFVDHRHGIQAERRIVEVLEVYEQSGQQIQFSFGEDVLSFIQKIKRDVKS